MLLVSGMPICTRTFRLPEISDETLFGHLKSNANPLRSENKWKSWSDDELNYMIRVYGANLMAINSLFAYPDSPIGITLVFNVYFFPYISSQTLSTMREWNI